MKEEALKLADELDTLHQYVPSEAPDMIRRLVEELDKTQHDLKKYDELAFDDLFKRGKPVAWMSPDGKVSQTEGKLFHIPLYTTPKPLSDEEIDKLIQDYKIGEFSGFYIDKAMTESMYARYNKVFAFVKAIEERHGIK